MKLNGYMIKERLKTAKNERDILLQQFKNSLWQFSDSNIGDPRILFKKYSIAEEKVVKIEEIQQKYNLQVMVEANGQERTLLNAIKSIGGIERAHQAWSSAIEDKHTKMSWLSSKLERNKDSEYAQRMIGGEEILESINVLSKSASNIRTAIAAANMIEVEFDDCNRAMFEC